MRDERDVKIAVMQSQIEGLREQHTAHKEEITKSLSNLADRVFDSINGMRTDIKDIYEFINHSRGLIAALLISSSILSELIFVLFSWILEKFVK